MLGKIYCCHTGRDTVFQARVVSCYYTRCSITARQADRTEACGFRPAAKDLGWVDDIFLCLFQLVCIGDAGNSLLCLKWPYLLIYSHRNEEIWHSRSPFCLDLAPSHSVALWQWKMARLVEWMSLPGELWHHREVLCPGLSDQEENKPLLGAWMGIWKVGFRIPDSHPWQSSQVSIS